MISNIKYLPPPRIPTSGGGCRAWGVPKCTLGAVQKQDGKFQGEWCRCGQLLEEVRAMHGRSNGLTYSSQILRVRTAVRAARVVSHGGFLETPRALP
jgi:hypothetical protein